MAERGGRSALCLASFARRISGLDCGTQGRPQHIFRTVIVVGLWSVHRVEPAKTPLDFIVMVCRRINGKANGGDTPIRFFIVRLLAAK